MNTKQLFDKVCDFEDAYDRKNPSRKFECGQQYEPAYKEFADKYGNQITIDFLNLLENENFHTCRKVCVEWLKKHIE